MATYENINLDDYIQSGEGGQSFTYTRKDGKAMAKLFLKSYGAATAEREFRISQALGIVAAFKPETFNDTIWFSRLGTGSIGGKARGLAFLNNILQKYQLYDKWDDVRVMVPRTLVITTGWFDRFISENGLKYVINADLSDEELLSEFVSSHLPKDLMDSLRADFGLTPHLRAWHGHWWIVIRRYQDILTFCRNISFHGKKLRKVMELLLKNAPRVAQIEPVEPQRVRHDAEAR